MLAFFILHKFENKLDMIICHINFHSMLHGSFKFEQTVFDVAIFVHFGLSQIHPLIVVVCFYGAKLGILRLRSGEGGVSGGER